MELKPIQDQVVVVMGASSGIGRETALRMARKGARVVVSARGQPGLDSLLQEIRQEGGEATAVKADASDYEQVKYVGEVAYRTYGRIDTWTQVAGVELFGRFDQTTPEEFHQLVEINLMGQVYGAMVALPYLKQEGRGALIHVSSIEARAGLPLQSAYSASKHGVAGFVDALRIELAHDHLPISVTEVVPGSINTPLFNNGRSKTGLKPMGFPPFYQPEVVADAIVYAATHPTREMIIGAPGKALISSKKLMPNVTDAFARMVGFRVEMTNEPRPADAADNLFKPNEGENRTHGDFDRLSLPFSFYTWLQKHPVVKTGSLAAFGVGALGVFTISSNKGRLIKSGVKAGSKLSLWALKRKLS